MGRAITPSIPDDLQSLRAQIEHWRETRQKQGPMPAALWSTAVSLAQERGIYPVNIYRLIAHGTIEERILALHHTKREMVHDLLEGTDLGGKLSTDELLQLIRAE